MIHVETYVGFVGLVGLIIGSFLNVVADRLSRDETLGGRSHCDTCLHTLGWYDLVPIISFLVLGGKCRYCKKTLSLQYIMVEVGTSLLFSITWLLSISLYSGFAIHIIHLCIVSVLWTMFLADIRYQIIPDQLQGALAFFTLMRMALCYHMSFSVNSFYILWSFVFAAMIVMLPLAGLHYMTKGRGMGFGDVKLAFCMGLMLGVWGGIMALYIGFISGALVGVVLLTLNKKGMKSKIAFGPFLILGIFLVLFYEQELLTLLGPWLSFSLV